MTKVYNSLIEGQDYPGWHKTTPPQATEPEYVKVRRDILDKIKEHYSPESPGSQAFNNGLAVAAHVVKTALETK